jgi:biopolymer transport protein ExbB/TolQ
MGQLLEILNAGGIFMYGILTTSVIATGIILQRVYSLWFQFRINADELRNEIARQIAAGNYGQATQLVGGSHPLHRMLYAALQRANKSEKEIRRAVETEALPQLHRIKKGTAALPQLSNLATLLGLLGTIHGLIITFGGMQGVDAAARQAALSKGVAVAFYNTLFGLSIATVTVVGYLIISGKQGRELNKIEHAIAATIDQMVVAPDARGGAASAIGARR